MVQGEQMNKSHELLSNLNFCVIDLETTGGNHSVDKIIEFGLVKVKNLEVVDKINYLLDPEIKIPDFIQKLTKIKPSDVKGKPKIEDVIEEILAYIGDDIIVAHNTSFDVPFMNSVLKRLKREPLKNKVLCTNVMTKYLIPEITNSNLSYMCSIFDIDLTQAHRAMEDAVASAELLIKYLHIFINKEIKKVNQIYYPKNKFELDKFHIDKGDLSAKKAHLLKIDEPCVLTLKGEKGVILGVIPLENPNLSQEVITDFLSITDWEILSIKLTGNLFEGLLYYNSHYGKYTEDLKAFTNEFLKASLETTEEVVKLDTVDILMTPHFIQGQFNVYPLFNLNTNHQHIFKVPGQQKKMHTFLKSRINLFEQNMKRKRFSNIYPELRPFFESYLAIKKDQFLLLSSKFAKESQTNFLKATTQFSQDQPERKKLSEIIFSF